MRGEQSQTQLGNDWEYRLLNTTRPAGDLDCGGMSVEQK